MQSQKQSSIKLDELRFPNSMRFYVVCKMSTFNDGQFNFDFIEGQIYEAFEMTDGDHCIVWFSNNRWEAVTRNTFEHYFTALDFSGVLSS
jgi:hypothetical protein